MADSTSQPTCVYGALPSQVSILQTVRKYLKTCSLILFLASVLRMHAFLLSKPYLRSSSLAPVTMFGLRLHPPFFFYLDTPQACSGYTFGITDANLSIYTTTNREIYSTSLNSKPAIPPTQGMEVEQVHKFQQLSLGSREQIEKRNLTMLTR
jgi:hypothetical protein